MRPNCFIGWEPAWPGSCHPSDAHFSFGPQTLPVIHPMAVKWSEWAVRALIQRYLIKSRFCTDSSCLYFLCLPPPRTHTPTSEVTGSCGRRRPGMRRSSTPPPLMSMAAAGRRDAFTLLRALVGYILLSGRYSLVTFISPRATVTAYPTSDSTSSNNDLNTVIEY